jgi:hypothetical protein
MVSELERKDKIVYQCEICGFGYKDIDTAEKCEQYCDTHGSCSAEITIRAVYKPPVRVMSVAA